VSRVCTSLPNLIRVVPPAAGAGPHARLLSGGFGPPCFPESRKRFADAVLEDMTEHREHRVNHRANLAAFLQR
jgi:hypothetical protein